MPTPPSPEVPKKSMFESLSKTIKDNPNTALAVGGLGLTAAGALALRSWMKKKDGDGPKNKAETVSKKSTLWKWLLGLGLVAGAGGIYGLGKAGFGGHLATGANNLFMRNSPEWLIKGARQVSSVAGTRFVNVIDGLRGLPRDGGSGFPAEHVRKNIAEGRGPGED